MLSAHALTTIDALKDELQISAEETGQNKLLARWINAASDAIRAYCGRDLTRARRIDMYHGSGDVALLLRLYPIVEVEQVGIDGRPVTDYTVDEQMGALWRAARWPRSRMPHISVDYMGGYVTPAQADDDEQLERNLPHDIEEACIVTAATWASQQGTPRDAIMMQVEQIRVQFGGRGGGQDAAQSLLPKPVQHLLTSYRRWV